MPPLCVPRAGSRMPVTHVGKSGAGWALWRVREQRRRRAVAAQRLAGTRTMQVVARPCGQCATLPLPLPWLWELDRRDGFSARRPPRSRPEGIRKIRPPAGDSDVASALRRQHRVGAYRFFSIARTAQPQIWAGRCRPMAGRSDGDFSLQLARVCVRRSAGRTHASPDFG